MVDKYYRAITHEDYKNRESKKFKDHFHHMSKKITTNDFLPLNENKSKTLHFYGDDEYMSIATGDKSATMWTGGIMLAGLMATFPMDEEWTVMPIIIFSICSFGFLFNAILYFTMPKKEKVYDRKQGRITFSDWFWKKNITMPFKNTEFSYSTGSAEGVGAFMLQIIRPTNYSFVSASLGRDCYESMSVITWYMDRNRPLPPGTAFDHFRQKDFERRKAEGFPPPLYPSQVPTPEATKEQQKERDKYWRDLE